MTIDEELEIYDRYPNLRALNSLRLDALEGGIKAYESGDLKKCSKWTKVANLLSKAAQAYCKEAGII